MCIPRPALHFNVRIMIAITVVALLSACGGLGGEPEVVGTIPPPPSATPQPEQPAQPEWSLPESPPDLVLGAEIYAQNCTECHGIGGAGDGPLVASGQVVNVPNFTDRDTVAPKTPMEYFEIITDGNLENLMPPWRNALSDEERWAVTMYTYMLYAEPEAIERGATIYAAECADCHGETGLGDGPQMIEDDRFAAQIAAPADMAWLNDSHIYTIINEGAGEDMPAFDDTLTPEEHWDVIAFVRTLSTSGEIQPIDAPSESAEEAAQAEVEQASTASQQIPGRITGEVIHGGDGVVPDDLSVTLHIYDMDFQERTVETSIQPDGSFVFEDVEFSPDSVYFASTTYRERSFANPPVEGTTGVMELPIVIYERTDDKDDVSIIGMVMQIQPVGDVLEVLQVVRFRNHSDKLYTQDQELAAGRFQSVSVPLPPGSIVVGVEGEERMFVDDETFTVYDTRSLLPGVEHFVRLSYLIPYGSGEAIIEFPVDYNVNGPVHVLLGSQSVTLESDQFPQLGIENIHERQYMAYGSNLNLPAGDVISYQLSGRPAQTGTIAEPRIVDSDQLLPVLGLIATIVVVIIGGAAIVITRKPAEPSREERIDALAGQIAKLDAAHERGEINHDLYQQRRAELKRTLAKIMETEE